MAESMLREEVEVYSEKYDIHGVVRDYGMVTKLFFTYLRIKCWGCRGKRRKKLLTNKEKAGFL